MWELKQIGPGPMQVLWIDGMSDAQVRNIDVAVAAKTDTVNEHTAAAGVTVDGLLIKDALIPVSGVPDLPTSKITSGRFIAARLLDGTSGYFLKAAGAGVDPAYALLVAADIPSLDVAKITSGRFGMARMPAGTSGQVLTAQGAGADPAYAAAASGDIFDKFREFISWVSVDGFTKGGDTGYSITPQGPIVVIQAPGGANPDAWLYTPGPWWNLVETAKAVTIEFLLCWTEATSITCWFRMTGSAADPPSETTNHFGFKTINARIWASNADGATQAITDTGIDTPTLGQRTRMKLIFNPGTDIKFYVNDTLAATHTTYLPATGKYSLHVHVSATGAFAREIDLGRVLLERVN